MRDAFRRDFAGGKQSESNLFVTLTGMVRVRTGVAAATALHQMSFHELGEQFLSGMYDGIVHNTSDPTMAGPRWKCVTELVSAASVKHHEAMAQEAAFAAAEAEAGRLCERVSSKPQCDSGHVS